MSNDALATDWDLIHRWEWFRRAKWREGFRAAVRGQGGGVMRAFGDLARLVDAKVLLDASCGLGRRAIVLAEQGLNLVGSDISGTAIRHAQDLAREENASVTFFRSPWPDVPKFMPHPFDGILATGLAGEPTWDRLGTSMVGLFHALAPGGFLMFPGAGEDDPADSQQHRLADLWNKGPHEEVCWFHREGNVTCALVRLKTRAADFIDDRMLYVSESAGEPRLEVTKVRRPGYWQWKHWRDLARMAGFEHLETRHYPGYGEDGGELAVNVAWKAKDGRPVAAHPREAAYKE